MRGSCSNLQVQLCPSDSPHRGVRMHARLRDEPRISVYQSMRYPLAIVVYFVCMEYLLYTFPAL